MSGDDRLGSLSHFKFSFSESCLQKRRSRSSRMDRLHSEILKGLIDYGLTAPMSGGRDTSILPVLSFVASNTSVIPPTVVLLFRNRTKRPSWRNFSKLTKLMPGGVLAVVRA